MERAIIIKPTDEIEVAEFSIENSFDFLKNFVKAENEDLDETYMGFYTTTVNFPCIDEVTGTFSSIGRKMSFCYNDNFLVTNYDDFEKINALATFILEIEMRGNVVLTLVDDGGETVGFNSREIDIALEGFNQFKRNFFNEINQLHEQYDGYKGTPTYKIVKA